MLKYIGHPLVDVGAATIAAFAGKSDPSELSSDDLDAIAAYIAENYTRRRLQGFLHGAVFPNSGYTNPAIKNDRAERFKDVLYAYRAYDEHNTERCALCGGRASSRVARQVLPYPDRRIPCTAYTVAGSSKMGRTSALTAGKQ